MLTRKRRPSPSGDTWMLQDAKSRFSEVVRRARAHGPQRVTVHGKDAVVVIAAEQFAGVGTTDATGRELVAAMREARRLGLTLDPARDEAPAAPPPRFAGRRR